MRPLSSGARHARAFQQELGGPRKSEYATSERNIGIAKEVWFIASTPSGDQFVATPTRGHTVNTAHEGRTLTRRLGSRLRRLPRRGPLQLRG
jgi:hypothetical protein